MQDDHQQAKAMTPETPPTRDYSSGDLLRAFWPYLCPHKGRILGAVLALVLVAAALLCMGRGLAYLVDEGLGKGDPALLDRAVLNSTDCGGAPLVAFCAPQWSINW